MTTPDTFKHWVEFEGDNGVRSLFRPQDIFLVETLSPKALVHRKGVNACVVHAGTVLIIAHGTMDEVLQKIHEALEGAVNEATEAIMALRGKS